MALPLGKLAILVGAGVVGSVLAKGDRLPSVSDFFSGAFKVVVKGLKHDESGTTIKKPRHDILMAQVNSLREELQLFASNRPVTIITATGAGASRYGAVVIVIVVGSGYVWWKGWKLPDLMFATRRSLSEARDSIAKQLENVYSSIGTTKRQLSSRMDTLDNNLDEVAQITASTKETITDISAEMETINANVAFVRGAVENLESKIGRIEGKQNMTNKGVLYLCNFASTLGSKEVPERIQASPATSRATIEAQPVTPSSRVHSLLPRGLSLELPSSSNSNGNFLESNGHSSGTESSTTPPAQNGTGTPESTVGYQSSSYTVFGRRFPSINPASFLTRTQSLSSGVQQQARSASGSQNS